MKKLYSTIVLLMLTGCCYAHVYPMMPRKVNAVGERSWLVRACYNRQSELNFMEIGIGRMNALYSDRDGDIQSFRVASAGFTFGADLGFGDTSTIIAPKMGIEVCASVIGARVTYAQYLQNSYSTGVIGVEGGLCVLSVFYTYVGYNFVKGNAENPVINEGPKFSIGINIPLWPKPIPEAKRPGQY